ncbi:hypothetical protein AMTRI_Chr13g125380 [Amborella trichopoda]
MDEFSVKRLEQTHTRLRNVPIAVTPEGFWCCPSPVVFPKTIKVQNPNPRHKQTPKLQKIPSQNKNHHPSSQNQKPTTPFVKQRSVSDNLRNLGSEACGFSPSVVSERMPKPRPENFQQKRVSVEFSEPETSDMIVILLGKHGLSVRMRVHRNILAINSTYFAEKLSQLLGPPFCVEIGECEDVESFVETVGLMYCKDVKQRLVKQSIPRVLRILKVSDVLGFQLALQTCLEYLEAVPWVGEEEEKVVSSILQLKADILASSPILKRITPELNSNPHDLLSHILQLIVKGNEEKGRREMKSLVSRLLRENNLSNPSSDDIYNKYLYDTCQTCLKTLLFLFSQEADSKFTGITKDPIGKISKERVDSRERRETDIIDSNVKISTSEIIDPCMKITASEITDPRVEEISISETIDPSLRITSSDTIEPRVKTNSSETIDPKKGSVVQQISLQADNLLWLVEILIDRLAADEFVVMWTSQHHLADLHPRLPIASRHLASHITARICIAIGKGEVVASREARCSLFDTWFQPLIEDYGWLKHACRSFDRRAVEEGVGRTILTLPLEDQRRIFVSWLNSFLKFGDSCPNLQGAFEVWWRRAFVRPYVGEDRHGVLRLDGVVAMR